MRIGSFVVFKEKAGVISDGPIWVCFQGPYMYESFTLLGLAIRVIKEWRDNRNFVG